MSKKNRKKSPSESLIDSFIGILISDTKKGLIRWITLDGFSRLNEGQTENETWWCCVYGGRGVYVRFVPGINVISSPRPIALHVSNHRISDVYSLRRTHVADTYTSSKLLELSRCIQEWRINSMIKNETDLRARQSVEAKICEDALKHAAPCKDRTKSYSSTVDIVIMILLVLLSIANLALAIAEHSN